MKGVEDFIWVFMIAIILLIALGVVGLAFPGIPSGVPGGSPALTFTTITEFSLGTVGFITDLPARTSSLGTFTVGETQSQNLRTIPQLKLETSVLGGNTERFEIEVPAFLEETADKVNLNFLITETNQFGKLIIDWNGIKVLEQKKDSGQVTLEIDKQFVKRSNSLTIYAEGPGAFFWAATIYLIKEFEINLEYGPSRLFSFELLPSELEAFEKGEINFFGIGTGNLVVKINGLNIFDGEPIGTQTIEFDFSDAPLVAGDNIVSFSSTGVANLNNVVINIFLLSNQIARSKNFDLTETEFAALETREGIIEFDVDSVDRRGILDIRLNGNLIKQIPNIVVGTHRATFTKNDVAEGTNTIEFTGTGSFEISSVRIGISNV